MMKRLLSMFILLLTAYGCGSSSGGSGKVPDGGETKYHNITMSGYVIDPPVNGAKVELQTSDGSVVSGCGANRNTICSFWSNEKGYFEMEISDKIDLRNLYFVSYGGNDSGYGINLEGISFSAPVSMFSKKGDGSYNVIVSPVTSMAEAFMKSGMTLEQASEKVVNALGLPAGTDIKVNPLENSELLKSSYLITKTALLMKGENNEKPVYGISEAIRIKDDKLVSSAVLASLFPDNQLLRQSVEDTAEIVKNASGNTDEIIAKIGSEEKLRMFKSAMSVHIPNKPSNPSTQYEENIGILFRFIESKAKRITLDQFSIHQLARFVIYINSNYASYAKYDKTTTEFSTELGSIVADSEMKSFTDSLKFLASETVYSVSVPLAEPLGFNNAKRVEYYFKSNADVNYLARKIMNKNYDDTTNDKIATSIANTYAKYGLYDRAENIAKTFIAEPETLAETYASMSLYIYYHSPDGAITYLDKARTLLNSIIENSDLTESLISIYIDLTRYYEVAGAGEKAQEIRTWLMSKADSMPESNDAEKSLKHNLIKNIFYYLSSSAEELAEEKQNAQAMIYADYILENIDKLGISSIKVYSQGGMIVIPTYEPHMNYLLSAIRTYRLVAESDNTKLATNIEKIESAFTKIKAYQKLTVANVPAGVYMAAWKSGVYGKLAGHIYWAFGKDRALKEVVDVIWETPVPDGNYVNISANQTSYMAMAAAAAKDGIASAMELYLSAYPIASDYAGITDMNGPVELLISNTATSSGKESIYSYALYKNNKRMAEEAVDYAVGILDNATVYHSSQGNYLLTDFVSGTSDYYSQRYTNKKGYLTIAERYIELGRKDKAVQTITKAEAYADSAPTSLAKTTSYAVIGYMYDLAGDSTKSVAAYSKAKTTEVPAGLKDKNYITYYLGLAYDAVIVNDADKVSIVSVNLSKAMGYISGLSVTNTDRTNTYCYIAELYAAVNNKEQMAWALEQAAVEAGKISSSYSKKNAFISIVKAYANLGYSELANSKAEEFLALNGVFAAGDRSNLFYQLANAVLSRNDTGTKIAFLDTDKDGKPDFFVPWATDADISASGLVLDDDIDGDGILDNADLTPFFAK